MKFILSPGTMSGIGQAPEAVLPTGEKCLVMRENSTLQFTETPDASGSIVMLSLPFFEAPWVRVYLDSNFDFVKWEARQLPAYANDPTRDPLKSNNIYAYRFVANGLTGTNTSAVLNAQGSVSCASLPLSLDRKVVYDSVTPAVPLSFVKCLDRIPLTQDGIASITNLMTTHAAIDGSYVVLRHTDASLPFTYRDSDMNKATFTAYANNATALDPCQEGSPAQDVVRVNYLGFSDSNVYGSYLLDQSGVPLPVTAPSCMDACITCYSGLNATDKITFKAVAAWEFIPKMNSTKIPQCRPMPPKNTTFLEELNTAELLTPALGIAADNSLGSFFKGALNIVSQFAPMVKQLASNIPHPAVATVVSKIADVLPQVNAVVNKTNEAAKQLASTARTVATVPQKVATAVGRRRK